MNDTYLRSLGFAPTDEEKRSTPATFEQSWRYQHERQASDGTSLFIEHPLGIASCRLSALTAPLDAQDVFADVALHDRAGLETAMAAFYTAHGGVGKRTPLVASHTFRPYRREQ